MQNAKQTFCREFNSEHILNFYEDDSLFWRHLYLEHGQSMQFPCSTRQVIASDKKNEHVQQAKVINIKH